MRSNSTRHAALPSAIAIVTALFAVASAARSETVAAVITITDEFRFSPDEVMIRAGDTVEWRNASHFNHTITDDPKLAGDRRNAVLPPGAAAFSSGEIHPGESYKLKLTAAGIYHYFCMPHEGIGMLGQIHVQPAK